MKRFAPFLFALALLSGCASGMKYTELKPQLPPLKEGTGRIVVYRPSSLGAMVKPDIVLGDEVIGQSKARGFFFVDKPAGQYVCSARSEVKRSVSFALESGETKYVRNHMTIGIMVGRLQFALADPEKAEEELQGMSYTGVWPLPAALEVAPASAPAPEEKPAVPGT
jgi:hypothetical protein